MKPRRSIAVAQTVPVRGDVEANLAQHLRLAHLAAAQQAELLVFPELSLTGYEVDLGRELAFSRDDSRLAPLADAAASQSITLIVGAPLKLNSRHYIAAFVLSPDAGVAIYTKHHLGAFGPSASCDGIVPPAEATVFDPGHMNPLLHVGGRPAAVAICADTGRPAHAQQAAERGARTYFASMFVIPSEFERETANLRRYAVQHRMCVAFANYGGPSGGLAAAGRSAIWSDTGELLAQLEPTGAGIAIAVEDDEGWRGGTVRVPA